MYQGEMKAEALKTVKETNKTNRQTKKTHFNLGRKVTFLLVNHRL